MDHYLGKYSEVVYAVLRMIAGVLFIFHGTQKLFGIPGDRSPLPDPLMVAAGIIELIGGGLVALGLWTGYAAFVASGTMAVAYFMAHASRGLWPIINKGELAVLYCFVFLYMAARGSGRLSIDAYRNSRKER